MEGRKDLFPRAVFDTAWERAISWHVQILLQDLYGGPPPPNVDASFCELMTWLNPPEATKDQALTEVLNLALSYKCRLDEVSLQGHWSESARQLRMVYQRAQGLVSALKEMDLGARSLWARAEHDVGRAKPGEGLLAEFHPERAPTMHDFSIIEGKGFVCINPPTQPVTTPPTIGDPTEELVKRLAPVLDWLKDHRGTTGRKTVSAWLSGPPELELFWEAKIRLVRLGLDHRMSYELGRRIHQLLAKNKEGCYYQGASRSHRLEKTWGAEIHRRVEVWYAEVGPWIGREAEAPAEVRQLLRKGPTQANTRATAKRLKRI